MTACCAACSAPLNQHALFRQRCPACHASHVARPGGFTAAGAVLGLVGPIVWVGSLFLPTPLWVPLVVVPLALVVAGVYIALRSQRWVARPLTVQ